MAAHSSLYCTFPSLCVSLCVKILHQTEDSLQAKLIYCSAAELFLVAGVSVFDPWKLRGSKAAHMLKELTLLYRHLSGGKTKVLALRPALAQRPDAPCSPPHTANFHIVIQKVLCDWQTLIKRKTHDQERRVGPHTGREWMARNQFVYESYYTKKSVFLHKTFHWKRNISTNQTVWYTEHLSFDHLHMLFTKLKQLHLEQRMTISWSLKVRVAH